MTILIGIDDTDNIESSRGTGRLARKLGRKLVTEFDVLKLSGVVRQQLLVDPEIPYTSHNSSACIIMEYDNKERNGIIDKITAFSGDYITGVMAEGSDPGLCITSGRDVKNSIVQFGIKAQNEVLNKKMAYALAKDENIFLTEYGGTGDGIIGALSAVGLTAGGNSGRFIEFGKIREFRGYVKAGELKSNGINVISETLTPIPSSNIINTMNWMRPRLYNGMPTLIVEKIDGCWKSIDRKKR